MPLSLFGHCSASVHQRFTPPQPPGHTLPFPAPQILYTTACADEDSSGDGSFAPLQVHYTERFSAAGRTSGGFLKREGKPKVGGWEEMCAWEGHGAMALTSICGSLQLF